MLLCVCVCVCVRACVWNLKINKLKEAQCIAVMIHFILYVKISELICYSIHKQCILSSPQHTFNTLNLKQNLALVFKTWTFQRSM